MRIATNNPECRLGAQKVLNYQICMLDLNGVIISGNVNGEQTKCLRCDSIIGQHLSVVYADDDLPGVLPARTLKTALDAGQFEAEGWLLRNDGLRFWGHVIVQPMYDKLGKTIGFAKIIRDMTEQKMKEATAKEQERNFRLLVQGVTDYAIYMLSPEGFVSNWNAGAERAKGYREEEIIGHHFSEFYLPKDRRNGVPQKTLALAQEQGKFEGEGWRLRKDGSKFWAHVVVYPVREEGGELLGFAKITRDVTERKRTEDNLFYMAHRDALTALLNRASFRTSVEVALKKGCRCVLLYLDLDRFKQVNDTMGHLVGDKVLQAIGERIAGQLRKTDLGGRLGGDEFAVVLVNCEHDGEAVSAAERFIREIKKPISINNASVSVGVSIGMASTDAEVTSAEILLRNADLALYASKKDGKSSYRCYEPKMEFALLQSKALESDLRLALSRNEFFLHYQPVIHAVYDRIIGYEALIRWESPTRGMVSPADFIPFAEEHGLIVEIGDWVLHTACGEATQWSDDLSIAINLSPAQFRQPNLAKKIAYTLESTGLPPKRLELEITETAAMGSIEEAKSILDEIRAMGIMVAMDDFGTGCSSLSFLRILPLTRIKIDKSFIQDLGKTQESLAIVRAVKILCSSLDLAMTAEGVETEDQMRILLREGCHDLQGYLLGRPTASPQRHPGQGRHLALPFPK